GIRREKSRAAPDLADGLPPGPFGDVARAVAVPHVARGPLQHLPLPPPAQGENVAEGAAVRARARETSARGPGALGSRDRIITVSSLRGPQAAGRPDLGPRPASHAGTLDPGLADDRRLPRGLRPAEHLRARPRTTHLHSGAVGLDRQRLDRRVGEVRPADET